MTEFTKLDMKSHRNKLWNEYANKLDFTNDQITSFDEIMNSVEAVLQKHNVHQQVIEWDRTGTKLVDGKVILPKGMQEVTNELIRDNELPNLFLPEEHGGFGYSNVFSGPLSELLSYYDLSFSIFALSGVGVMNLLVRYYKEHYDDAIQKLAKGKAIGYAAFTEPQAGSNLRAIKCTSELDGDEYVINGTKIYISNGGIGEIGIVLTNNIVNGKKEGTNVLLVDGQEGLKTVRLEEKSGLKASATAQLLYENVRVPKENIIAGVGIGYDKVIERLMAMRLSVAFQALASCRRAYDLAYNYADTREQFGRTIINFPDIQRKLKSIGEQTKRLQEVAYGSAFALDLNNKMVDQNYEITDRNIPDTRFGSGIPHGIKNNLIHYYISSSKLYCSEISNYLLYDAQQVFGGLGFISETEINKIARDVRVLPVFDGTSEIHKWLIQRSLPAIEDLDIFTSPHSAFMEPTHYEKILYSKFPSMEHKL